MVKTKFHFNLGPFLLFFVSPSFLEYIFCYVENIFEYTSFLHKDSKHSESLHCQICVYFAIKLG